MAITSDRDILRLEIGDTDPAAPLFADDELDVFLDRHPDNRLQAAADACDALARRFAAKVDTSLTSGSDTVKRTYSNMVSNYTALAAQLRARATVGTGGAPWHGGGSRARKDTLAGESDRVQPTFSRGQFNLPGGR